MSDWTVILRPEMTPQTSGEENYPYSSTSCIEPREIPVSVSEGHETADRTAPERAGQTREIKSAIPVVATNTSALHAARRAHAKRKDGAAFDIDPLTLGLMTALAASLAAAPAAALPSHAPDAGVPNERPDGQVHADLVPKANDPAQDPSNDDPSATGSIPSGEGSRQAPQSAHRLIGSSTPPDVWQSVETPPDNWASQRFEQSGAPLRQPSTSFGEQQPPILDLAGFPGPTFANPTPLQIDAGTPAGPVDHTLPQPDTTTHPMPPTAGPVARDDGGYIVVKGARTIQATSLLANDIVSAGAHLTISSVFNAQHGLVTYEATTQSITFTATDGYRGQASFSYTVTDDAGHSAQASVSLFVVPDETLFGAAAIPTIDSANDANPVELGVKFVSAADGLISGLRFYKGIDNVGVHTASLWDASGNLLATATFDAETGSGWQQVSFSSPVAIQAGVTYVASYHTNGFYSTDSAYFTSPVTNGDLTAIGSVYTYGAGNSFPTSTYNASNYWVDVVYNRPPAAPEAHDDVIGVIGNRATSFASSWLLANDVNPDGIPFAITSASNALHGTLSFDALTQAVTFTPTEGYSGTASFSYTVTNNLGASATADVKFWVDGAQPASFYGASTVPSIVNAHDGQSVELGFKFQSVVDGQLVGLRFYKSADNTGTHVGNLWSATGDLLATATFTNETSDGWQEVLFSTPVSLTAGTTYVASYHTDGNYSADPGSFASAQTNGTLIAPASTVGSGNGLYAYGSSSLFPTNSYNATGYGVDVLFKANLVG
jgi:hypothetical protein